MKKIDLSNIKALQKIPTGIRGFEHISQGGIPHNRITLISGSSGAGKTFFSVEFLMRSIEQFDRRCVYVATEEPIADIASNALSLGWNLGPYQDANKLAFLDAVLSMSSVEKDSDLQEIIAEITAMVEAIDASVLIIDSLGGLFRQVQNASALRRGILHLANTFKQKGLTIIITAERVAEYGAISRYNVEEFAVDNVIILRNILEEEKVRRTIQILKMRGATHAKGEFPIVFTAEGINILALSEIELKQSSSGSRCSFGNNTLDKMTGGGIFRDSVLLVSGPTGSGKTLICATFVEEACKNREKIIIFAYEESCQQLMRNASSWGIDFKKWEAQGLLRIICLYPETQGLEEHLFTIRSEVNKFKPTRLIMDSVSALERVSSVHNFREFILGLTSFIKQQEVCGLFTSTTPYLSGGDGTTEAHILTITDIIILLRYVEVTGSMQRGITVIKMRGSQHQKEIRRFEINGSGLHIGEAFKNVENSILGIPATSIVGESERLARMFSDQDDM